jgi:hypothetical protein
MPAALDKLTVMRIEPNGRARRVRPAGLRKHQIARFASENAFDAASGSDTDASLCSNRLASYAKRFRRADLNDPEKRERIVQKMMEELVREECPGLPPEHRSNVTNWMVNDPYLRETLMRFLDKILS